MITFRGRNRVTGDTPGSECGNASPSADFGGKLRHVNFGYQALRQQGLIIT
jgi:hypothetical protein